MKETLSDLFKFQKISIQQNEVLNNIVHMELLMFLESLIYILKQKDNI